MRPVRHLIQSLPFGKDQAMSERKFQIVCDSCCDLPKEDVKELGIDIVPLYVSFDGVDYKRDFYDFSYHDFYQSMLDNPGVYPKTSLPSLEDYINVWEPYVREGMPVLSISMTSGMSGSYNAALNAKEVLLDRYKEAQIEVVDSQALTLFEGMLVREAAGLRDAGLELSEAVKRFVELRKQGRAYFTIGDLSYLIKGGRVGSLVKLAAVSLGIKPVILFSEGNINLVTITRSRQRSYKELAKQTVQFFVNSHEDPADYHIEVGYGLLRENGEELMELFGTCLKEAGLKAEYRLSQIGTVVGAHNGPDLMGIAIQKRSLI